MTFPETTRDFIKRNQRCDQSRDVRQHSELRVSRDHHPGAGEDVFTAIQRQMVGKLVRDDLCVDTEAVVAAGNRRGQSARLFAGGNLCDRLFALTAGTLMTADFPNEQFGRNQVKPLADVGANDRHLFATA